MVGGSHYSMRNCSRVATFGGLRITVTILAWIPRGLIIQKPYFPNNKSMSLVLESQPSVPGLLEGRRLISSGQRQGRDGPVREEVTE